MNNKPHTLIISTGNQDLKLICKKTVNSTDAEVLLAEIGRQGRRLLHQSLLNKSIKYKLIANQTELEKELKDNNIKINPGWESSKNTFIDPNIDRTTRKIAKDKPFKAKTWENRDKTCVEITEPLCNSEGEYLLFPAKLHSVISAIQDNQFNITGGLVFYTDRTLCELDYLDKERANKLKDQYNQEPVATGKILADWLKERFANTSFTPINFLDGLYAFEGNTIIEQQALAPYDQPIALKATHIIDSAIQKLSEAHPDSTAVISHTGGIADAKAVITPSARLHFNGRILELHDSEHIPNDPVCLANSQQQKCRILPRNAILDAKHHAAQRLWEGDFTGAWAVVSHIKQDDKQLVCDAWVNKVKAIADYMEGYISETPFDSNNFKKQKEILWKAFQVEAALQNQQGGALIIRLLRALGTFREAMENELCKRQLEAEGFTIGNKNKINTKPEKYNSEYDNFIFTRYGQEEFSSFRHNDLLIKYVGYEMKIVRFFTSMEERICNNGKSLRNFRNDVTHNNPPNAEILNRIDTFGNEKKLWNSTPNGYVREKIGTCFLSMDMTKALFKEINSDMNAEQIYKDMLLGLLDEIGAPIPENC